MMNALQADCRTNDSMLLPIESLRFPLDSTMQVVFTGYYSGFGVEVRATDEVALLYHMGCFGKGSASRSKPKAAQSEDTPVIMRKRQFLKRNYWSKKFSSIKQTPEEDAFMKDIDELSSKIAKDCENIKRKDVIDLVSSDEETSGRSENNDYISDNNKDTYHDHENEGVVVIVPNSDSEDENYFANLKAKCCVNRIKVPEKLMLTLQEAFFLMYGLGCLQIVNFDNKLLDIQQSWDLFTEIDKRFIPKYVVYHYFRSKGYVVKPGIKFGGDYLLYKEGPEITHADYIVVIKHGFENNDWISILGHVRMAVTTVKEILIAEVVTPNSFPKLPEGLSSYTVKEMSLTRKLPVTINDDVE